ncbi:histidine phosphatase family protein [Candidatus Woesearchaeota archaeon]|nr:histidine phosphatase family protein [Candidatus Woesearchaeota archaeon]
MVYTARHGQTDYNLKMLYQGAGIDVSLNSKGRQDAMRVKEIFKDVSLDVIICSPLKRAQESILPLAKEKKFEVITWRLIAERYFGVLEGKSYSHLDDPYNFFYDNNNGEMGEPMEIAYQRAELVKKRLIDTCADRNVFLMSHGILLSIFCCAVKEEGVVYRPEHRLGNGKFHQFEITENEKFSIKGLNLDSPVR